MWALAFVICAGVSSLGCAVVQHKQMFLTEEDCRRGGMIVQRYHRAHGRPIGFDCKELELPDPPKREERPS